MESLETKTKLRDSDLPWLLRERQVAINFVVFYISIVCLMVNLLILCPCCFFGNFTLCCPTCRITPIILTCLVCTSLGGICIYQTRPILDPEFAKREILRYRASKKDKDSPDVKNV